jgi:HEAT repeat protein
MEFLVDRLCQKDPVQGEEIADLLGSLGERAVDALLQRLIVEENMFARRRLLAAIVQQGEMALPPVLRGLDDERWFVLRNMAIILAELGFESSVEALGQHLRHQDRRVRREVARAIAKIGGRHAPRLLRERLTDPDPMVCQQAIIFLGAMHDSRAFQPLMAIAQGRARDRDEMEVRKAAILALGQVGNKAALPVLVRLMRPRSLFRRAEPEEVRFATAAALGQLGGPEAVAALQRAMARGGRVGAACQQALERLGA